MANNIKHVVAAATTRERSMADQTTAGSASLARNESRKEPLSSATCHQIVRAR